MKRRVVLAALVCFAAVLGAFVAPASAAVAAPTGVLAVSRSGSTIEVSWARSPGFATYKVYRAPAAGGPYTLIGTTPALRLTNGSLESGTRYFYTVRAVVSNVTSPPSTAVDVRTFTPTTATTVYLNANHDNSQPDESLPDQPRQLWSKDLGGQVSYPLVVDGLITVAVANSDWTGMALWAFRAGDGSTAWGPIELGGTYQFPAIAYGAGAFFAGNSDGMLRRINATTGAVEWQRQLPDAYLFQSEPVVAGDTLYLSGVGAGGTVFAVNVVDGTLRWTLRLSGADGSPVVTGDALFICEGEGWVYRIDAETGELSWVRSTPIQGPPGYTMALHKGKLYVRDFTFPAVLDAETGAEVAGHVPSMTAPAFAQSEMFDAEGSKLSAFSDSDGGLLWSFENTAELSAPPVAMGDGRVVIADRAGDVSIVQRHRPQLTWRGNAGAPVGGNLRTGVAVAHGLIVVPATNRLTVFG